METLIVGWFIIMFIGMAMVEYRLSKIQRLLEKDRK
jgi:hypothetical protein